MRKCSLKGSLVPRKPHRYTSDQYVRKVKFSHPSAISDHLANLVALEIHYTQIHHKLCIFNRASVGVDFQEELSDTLLLTMLQAATRASADKDRVRALHFIIKRKKFLFCETNESG